MRPQSFDAFRLAVTDGEVVMDFGPVEEVRGVRTMALGGRISLPPETAARLLHGLREAGVHRDGRDFFNVCYGVAGFPRFATARG